MATAAPQESSMIWVRNLSGQKASYALIVALPVIKPAIDPHDISTNIVATFSNVPSGSGVARFEIPKQIHPVCGTSVVDSSRVGSILEVFDQRPIDMARQLDDGTVQAGTVLDMVNEDAQPAFADHNADQPGFYSSFTPRPRTVYYIQPKATYGLVLGDLKVRSRFDIASSAVCEIDFAKLGVDDVEVIHTEHNELVVSRS
ncbi:hypothetical protein MMC13_004671 [Lambiella insularis]|nr:hypothetical protein [Lambiella insularis]